MGSSTLPKASSEQSSLRAERMRIRNRLISIFTLLLVIFLLFSVLLNYSGFHDWETIDTNLAVFVAVNVNIVLLTTVFYMLLRNLFKLVYESRNPISGVGLKTKLIIAFVALSLPSTAFHLLASGYMAFLFETWSKGEHKQVLESAQVVMEQLSTQEDKALRRSADELMAYLPREAAAYQQSDWMGSYSPSFSGGISIYNAENQLIAQWASNEAVHKLWSPPPTDHFTFPDGFYWNERVEEQTLRRLLLPMPGTDPPLKVELTGVEGTALSQAMGVLTRKQANSRFFSHDLLVLVMSVVVVMALLIIFAATWISFYLARGFATPVERLANATERVSQGELGYQVPQGSLGPLEWDFRGLVSSFNAMSRQLGEQRQQLLQSQEELRNSHHALGERNRVVELLLENIDAGIIFLNNQGQISAYNRAGQRLVQARGTSWQDRHYRVVLPREMVSLMDDLRERQRASGTRQTTQNIALPTNRKTAHLEVTLLGLENKEGYSEGTVLMLKDVTAMQRNQRALAWREVAKRIAHEIKNPLTPIQLSAQRIRRRYLRDLNGDGEVLDQCTQEIISQVTSLKKMVNEFSQFAKLPESRPVPESLNGVIEEMARFYDNGLPEQVTLQLKLAGDLPPFPLDREQMKRALTNLIDNAAASLHGPGEITLRTAYDAAAQQIVLEVSDTGDGVPEHIRSRLFEPYTSTKSGGTGLGLTIVNQIVSDHNGFIRYSDNRPHGAVFTMEFHLR